MDIVTDYYTGFEGEPEIRFITSQKNGNTIVLRIWYGYFFNIMNAMLDSIEPGPEGWTGLAYYFSAVEGWYDESPWKIPDKQEALNQFAAINTSTLNEKTKGILKEVCFLITSAQSEDYTIWIEYD